MSIHGQNSSSGALPRRVRKSQAGIVMLLALIALLLISAVGASILFMAAGESTLVGRQRTSTQVLFGGVGGLEEARMRLNSTDPYYLCPVLPPGDCDAQNMLLFPTAVGQVIYILNPANAAEAAVLNPTVCPGGVVLDANGNETCPSSIYYDWEFQREFGLSITNPAVALRMVNSEQLGPDMGPLTNPNWPTLPYKWVRITIKTEQAGRQDINGDGLYDNATPVYYDSAPDRQIVTPVPPNTARQVYRLTALATMPDGTERIVQYDVGGRLLVVDFPSAVTMVGTGLNCQFANSAPFDLNGNDQAGVPGEGGPAIGVINPAERANCRNGIPAPRVGNYTGTDGNTPSVADITQPPFNIDPNLLTTAGLQQLMDMVRLYADQTFTSPDAPSDYFSDGNGNGRCDGPAEPLITVVEGDLRIGGRTEGCGILLVTGKLTMGGTPRWNGIVLVIGEGEMDYNGGGRQGIAGTVFVAKIYDAAGNPLPAPAGGLFNMPGGGTADINFNSAFINNALNRVAYRVLAFRDISR
ncbi:MAG: hypothetical protein ACE5MH_05165 [Terriglobia bacterium]